MRVPILMYHMVCESSHREERRYACPPTMFRRQMAYLKRAGYRVISLEDLATSLAEGKPLDGRQVVITFDDGFRDNYTSALPVLKEYGYPATVFVVSGSVAGANQWMVQNGYPRRELASWNELREMAENGIEIGSHTVSHAALDELDEGQVTRELQESKAEIEHKLMRPVRFFAYPYGRLSLGTPALVKAAGYEAACSTRSGFNHPDEDTFALRRIEVLGTDTLWKFRQKLKFGTNEIDLLFLLRYYTTRFSSCFGHMIFRERKLK